MLRSVRFSSNVSFSVGTVARGGVVRKVLYDDRSCYDGLKEQSRKSERDGQDRTGDRYQGEGSSRKSG